MVDLNYQKFSLKKDENMKNSVKRLLLPITLLAFGVVFLSEGSCSSKCNITTHTTFVPRLMTENSVLELALHNYYHYHLPECDPCECPSWINLEFTAPYYFRSTKGKELAKYFLPGCKECLVVAQNNTSDISSPWLELITPSATPYQSTICIDPERSVLGGAFKVFLDLSRFFEGSRLGTHWWASVFAPVQKVWHKLRIKETPSAVPGQVPGIENEIDAFNNPAWNYGKWSVKTLEKVGVDDVNIKLGLDFYRDEENHAGFYGQVFAPTGKGAKALYLFEPLVGGNHVGAGAGFNGDYHYGADQVSIDFMTDIRYAYFFKGQETRSIDLFNGDFTRYLLVVTPNTETQTQNQVTPLPGINYFTKEVTVTPGSFFEIWAAMSFNYCNWHAEVGYDFWYRSKEKVWLADQDLGVGIFDIGQVVGCNVSASCARICQAVAGQPDAPVSDGRNAGTFVTVKNSEAMNKLGTTKYGGADCCPCAIAQPSQCSYLNLDSAASPTALSSTIYGALSYDCCMCCEYPVMVGVGGQYEFAHRRSALNQFGVWLKTALSF